jgi:hypothetical protein
MVHGQFNRFLAALPPHDFSLLVPHFAHARALVSCLGGEFSAFGLG